MAGFDTLKLNSFASLNRTRLADVPAIDPVLRGRRVIELLSSGAFSEAIAADAGALGLESQLRAGNDLLPAFDACLASMDERVRSAALELAVRFGTYLGYLLVSLAGEPSTAGVEAEETDAYRRHWSGVRHVLLGGGVVRGALGRVMREVARDIARTVVAPEFRLEVADHARELPLIGAALGVRDPEARTALVCDFGGSWVKRGYASYEDGTLKSLRLLPPLATTVSTDPAAASPETLRSLGDAMATLIAEGYAEGLNADLPLSAEAACSVNGYVNAQRPSDMYSRLQTLDGAEGGWLSNAVSDRLGREVDVTLAHDGTAAARNLAGRPDAAVVMLGTWLGVGFPPKSGAVRPMAPDFRVERHT